jgi:hypothetical protein
MTASAKLCPASGSLDAVLSESNVSPDPDISASEAGVSSV